MRKAPVEGEARRLSPRTVQAVLTALLVLPLVVAAVALRHPRWFPILDLAMTELRVRDVGSRHTPLIGLPGRIGGFDANRGSHPGPLSFWLLAPTYRLLGSSAWAMEAGTVLLHGIATSCALWLGRRRGGTVLMLGVAAMLALLMRSYGAEVLTQPWNPYLPVLWWTVLMLAVWCVLCRDIVALPVAVFAASFCAQTHVPYVGLTGGLGLVALAGAAVAFRRGNGDERRRILRWGAASLALAVVLWSPALVDQAVKEPGNLSILVDHFASPPEEPVGLRQGVEMTLRHLDPWRLSSGSAVDAGAPGGVSNVPDGSIVPGAVTLVVWAAAVAGAGRIRHGALLRLHLVVGVSLLLATYAISRVFGLLWYYLMLWAWGIAGLLFLAVGWTAVAVLARRTAPSDRPAPWLRYVPPSLLAVTVVTTAVFTVQAARVEQPAVELSEEMAVVVPEVLAALDEDDVPFRGHDERYLVTWADAANIGAQGISLVNELERSGFDVGVVRPWWDVQAARHRARAPAEATASIHLAAGDGPIAEWRAHPDAVEVAWVDRRTPAQRDESARVRARIVAGLEDEGLGDLVPLVDGNLFIASIDERPSDAVHRDMARLLDLGQPVAIFVGPVTPEG